MNTALAIVIALIVSGLAMFMAAASDPPEAGPAPRDGKDDGAGG